MLLPSLSLRPHLFRSCSSHQSSHSDLFLINTWCDLISGIPSLLCPFPKLFCHTSIPPSSICLNISFSLRLFLNILLQLKIELFPLATTPTVIFYLHICALSVSPYQYILKNRDSCHLVHCWFVQCLELCLIYRVAQ